MENKASSIGLTYGFIAGLLLILLTVLLYMNGAKAFLSPAAYLGYVIIIAAAVLAGIKQRKLNGGYLEFWPAVKVVFTVFAVGFLLQTIFNYILLNIIDPTFKEQLMIATMEKTEEILRRFGTPDSQIDEVMKASREQDSFSFGNQLLGYGVLCIMFFLISLLIAAIVKRKRPEFDNDFNTQL